MIGNGYWSTGITCVWSAHIGSKNGASRGPGWGAELTFLDGGFNNDDVDAGWISTQGTLRTRYYVPDGNRSGLEVALDVLLFDARTLGIEFRNVTGPPSLTVPGDGERDDIEYAPDYRWALVEQAQRLGWWTYDWSPETAEATAP